jgi:hypothetical protein
MQASETQSKATVPQVKSGGENISIAKHWWRHDVTAAQAGMVTSAYIHATVLIFVRF